MKGGQINTPVKTTFKKSNLIGVKSKGWISPRSSKINYRNKKVSMKIISQKDLLKKCLGTTRTKRYRNMTCYSPFGEFLPKIF